MHQICANDAIARCDIVKVLNTAGDGVRMNRRNTMLVNRVRVVLLFFLLCLLSSPASAQPAGAPGCGGSAPRPHGCVRAAFTASRVIASAVTLGIRHALTGTQWTDQASTNIHVPLVVYFPGGNASESFTYRHSDLLAGTIQNYQINVENHISAAARAWNQLIFPIRHTRHDIANEQEGRPAQGIVVRFEVTRNIAAPAAALGYTLSEQEPRVVSIYLPAIFEAATRQLESIRRVGVIPADSSIESFAAILLTVTLTHELGHAFSLGHSTGPVEPRYSEFIPALRGTNQRTGGVSGDQMSEVVYDERPSIMAVSAIEYLFELARMWRRPIVAADIYPSLRDVESVNRLFTVGSVEPAVRESMWQKFRNFFMGRPDDEL